MLHMWALSSSGGFTPSSDPSPLSYVLTGLVTLVGAMVMYMTQEAKKDKRLNTQRLDEQDAALATLNQSMAVLVSQVSPVAGRLDKHDEHLSALGLSTALLQQALQEHIRSALEKESRMQAQLERVRNGGIGG